MDDNVELLPDNQWNCTETEIDSINEIKSVNLEDCSQKENQNNSTKSFIFPTYFKSETLIELSNSSWSQTTKVKDVQPYLRGCKWSPDGTCCLSVVHNDGVHVTELPRDLYTGDVVPTRNIDILDSIIHVKEAGLVYDFCWYPSMNSQHPETCCWLTTMQNAPVQMWDAFDGSLRCTYRGFNAVDEMEPALSLTFDTNGSSIIAGYKKCLRTFDVNRPGREFSEHKISSPAACFAADTNLLAVGSWNTTISLYSVNDMSTYRSIGKMHGHSGGVTHIKFAPDGYRLVSGARKDHRLLVWDIRFYRRPLNILTRTVDTNQRVYFDFSSCGRYLVTGGTDGILKVWDSKKADWQKPLDASNTSDNVTFKFPVHQDCCNSVSLHPLRPILATGSGQYHFPDPMSLEDEIEDETDPNLSLSNVDMKYSSASENSLVFWWIGDIADNT